MTDRDKLQLIKQWIDEAIRQGNQSVLVFAIKSILDEKTVVESETSPVRLSEKSIVQETQKALYEEHDGIVDRINSNKMLIEMAGA
jgi:hypothetical protein